MNDLLRSVIADAINPALQILPAHMDTPGARVMLLATGLQESDFQHRRQVGGGPGVSWWQFECRGGVVGVFRHVASHQQMRELCHALDVPFDVVPVYEAMATNDVLAAGMARLLLWTDRRALPALGDQQTAWAYYKRNWNPGKPRPARWPTRYGAALAAVKEA